MNNPYLDNAFKALAHYYEINTIVFSSLTDAELQDFIRENNITIPNNFGEYLAIFGGRTVPQRDEDSHGVLLYTLEQMSVKRNVIRIREKNSDIFYTSESTIIFIGEYLQFCWEYALVIPTIPNHKPFIGIHALDNEIMWLCEKIEHFLFMYIENYKLISYDGK